MNLAELCNREVVIIEPDEPVLEAAKLMRQYHVGDLVVVEKRQEEPLPIGLLTDRDIVIEIVAAEVGLETVTVGDVMSTELLTVSETATIADAIKLMRDRGVRRLPVVNEQGSLEGIITVDDLIDILAELMKDIVCLISSEQQRERRKKCV